MMDKLVITLKESKTITMTIRIDKSLQNKYNELAVQTNRSRNELINMLLDWALEHAQILESDK